MRLENLLLGSEQNYREQLEVVVKLNLNEERLQLRSLTRFKQYCIDFVQQHFEGVKFCPYSNVQHVIFMTQALDGL